MRLTTLVLLVLFSCNLNAAGKSAFISTKELLEKSPQAISANQLLQDEFGEREQSLRQLAISIQEMEKNYRNDGVIMSSEQKKKAEENIVQNKRKFQFEQQSLKEDIQSKQRELLQKVQTSIREVIKSFGEKNGYDFIFTDSSVAFASDSVDITPEILKELEKQ